MIGAYEITPYVRLFPIWKFGSRYNIFGEYVGDGWYSERYGQWKKQRA